MEKWPGFYKIKEQRTQIVAKIRQKAFQYELHKSGNQRED